MIPTLKPNETHHIDRRAVTLLNIGLAFIGGAVLYIEHRNKKQEPLIPQAEAMALADHAYRVGRDHAAAGVDLEEAFEAPEDVPGWVPDDARELVEEPALAEPSLVDDETPPA